MLPRPAAASAGTRHHARRARVQLACDVGGRIRIDERDVDAVHVLGARGLEVEIEKIGKVQPDLARDVPEACRVRCRFVDSGDAELACSASLRGLWPAAPVSPTESPSSVAS